jgi:hypothetical protein
VMQVDVVTDAPAEGAGRVLNHFQIHGNSRFRNSRVGNPSRKNSRER